jgi:hypothetical protein
VKLKTKFESKAKLKYNRNEKFHKRRNTNWNRNTLSDPTIVYKLNDYLKYINFLIINLKIFISYYEKWYILLHFWYWKRKHFKINGTTAYLMSNKSFDDLTKINFV